MRGNDMILNEKGKITLLIEKIILVVLGVYKKSIMDESIMDDIKILRDYIEMIEQNEIRKT